MTDLEAAVDALLVHLDGREHGPVLAAKIERLRQIRHAPIGPLWDCGHHHPTRREVAECKRRQAGAFC